MQGFLTKRRALATAASLALCGAAAAVPNLPPKNVEINALSNRADLVSGGDVLVEVRLPINVPPHQLALSLNGNDVTSQFQYVAAERRFVALLGGLVEGANRLVADANGKGKGRPYASLTITNHSRGGPIFSGPQLQPWVCATVAGSTVNVNVPGTALSSPVVTRISGLEADAVDAKCNAPSSSPTTTSRRRSRGLRAPSRSPAPTPASSLQPGLAAGAQQRRRLHQRPWRDRQEPAAGRARTMNRGIYELVTFFDPAQPSNALSPQKGWNGKLLWMFGASAAVHRLQAPTTLNTIFNEPACARATWWRRPRSTTTAPTRTRARGRSP
jgi:hypothetical protein